MTTEAETTESVFKPVDYVYMGERVGVKARIILLGLLNANRDIVKEFAFVWKKSDVQTIGNIYRGAKTNDDMSRFLPTAKPQRLGHWHDKGQVIAWQASEASAVAHQKKLRIAKEDEKANNALDKAMLAVRHQYSKMRYNRDQEGMTALEHFVLATLKKRLTQEEENGL